MNQTLTLRSRLLAHGEVCRADTLFYVGFVALAGALAVDPPHSTWRLIGVWAAPTMGWIASLYGGDYFDRKLDPIAKPNRPIPSGRMSAQTAFLCMCIAILAGGVVAVALNPLNVLLVVAAAVLGISYSRTLKAMGILGNLARGGPTALALLLGSVSVTGTVSAVLVVVALILWLHDSSSNLVGALGDVVGDANGGYGTFPVKHGDVATVRTVIGFDLAWIALALALPFWWRDGFAVSGYALFLLIAILLTGRSVGILLAAPRPIERLHVVRAHEVIVIERLMLPAAVVAGHSGLATSLALLVPSLALTLVGQAVMRPRYDARRPRVVLWPGGHA